MKKYLIKSSLWRQLGLLSVMCASATAVKADQQTWWGLGATANWSDAGGNWTNTALNAAVPAAGDDLIFANANQPTSINDLVALTINSLSLTVSGGFTFSGNPLTIASGITNTADGATFNLPLILSGAQTFELDASSVTTTFNYAITNTGNLTIQGVGDATWSNSFAASVPVSGLRGAGNLIVNGPGAVTINGGFLYPASSLNFAGSTIVNGGTLNMNAGCFDGNSQVGQSLTINPGGTVITGAPHIAGSSGRPLSVFGGKMTMGAGSSPGEAYFTTVILSNATFDVGGLGSGDLRGNGSFTNLASAGETIFGVSLSLTSSRVIGVDKGTVTSPDPGVDINFSGNGTSAIQGSGNLTKVGPGTMLISGADIHTGTTTISAGKLALTGTMNNTPTITVASNAVFDISGTGFSLSTNQTLLGVGSVIGTVNDSYSVTGAAISPGGNNAAGVLSLGGLNLQGNGLMLNFDLANTTGIGGGTNDLLIVTNFSVSGSATNTVNISFLNGTPLAGGTYTLIQYTTGPAAGPVTALAAVASRYNYNFFSDGSSIKVTVTGTPGNLVWKGDGLTNGWDINTTSNWLLSGAASAYLAGDNATFNDSGSNNTPIYLTVPLAPTILSVSNNAKNYTFAGVGKITGGSLLVKNGSGNLTLLTTNDFVGGGSLNGSGTVTVGNGVVAGALGTGKLTNNTRVTFFENTSATYAGNMSGTGSVTAFMPGATLTLTGTNTFTGGLVALAGTTQIGNNTVGVSPSVTGNITNYSTLNLYRSDTFTNQNNITSAGNTLEYGNGDVNVRGPNGMTVDGSGSINLLPQGSLSVGQSAYGKLTVNSGGLINSGYGFYLGNPGSTSGDVIQNGGTINVGNQLRIAHWGSEISTYTINGGTLNVPNAQLAVGWDGVGLLTLNNGTINCRSLTVDDSSAGPAIGGTNSTFTMTGGQLNIGVNGISSVSTSNQLVSTVILGGGTIGTLVPSTLITAGWSSSLYMRLTNSGPVFDSSNSVITLSGILSGSGGLTKQGSGYLNLNGVNTYTNVTTVAAGTLEGSGTIVGPISVQSGAALSAGTVAGTTLTLGTLTTSNVTVNTGANVVIKASSTAATNDLLYVKGALALNNNPLIFNFLGGTPFTGGAYTIVSNLVARTGTLTYVNPTRYAATVDQSQANRIQVSFTGTNANLVWQGNVSSNWNVNADANWLNAGLADKYYQSDAVVFDNTGIAKPIVNLATAVTPASITVDATGNYTFAGSPITGVASLTKSGSGTLTLLNTNSYAGITTIAGGTLQVGNGGTSGSLPVGGTVVDYGSLVFNRSDTANFNGVINGPGSLTQAGSGTLLITATQNHYGGTTINPGSTVQLGNGALADSGSLGSSPATNNGTVNFFRLSSIAVATPYTGAGNFNFLGTGDAGQSGYSLNATNTFTGPVTLSTARIQSGVGAYSFGGSTFTVNPGSQVYAVAVPYSSVYSNLLTLAGTGWQDGLGALRIENGGTWAGNITLANNARIGVNNASTNFIAGTISGNYELETYGGNAAAALVLAPAAGVNSFNALRVSIGTAGAKTIVGNANAIPNNIPLTMNGGTLALNGFNQTFASYLNLNSSSSFINGSTTSPANITLAPSVNASFTYNCTNGDGGPQPLNVTINQSGAAAGITMSTLSPAWTGNFTNNGGTITSGTQNTPFGSQAVIGRNLVFNNSSLVTTLNNVLAGYNGSMVFNNSTWTCNRYVSFAPSAGTLTLINSTLTGSDSTDGSYEMLSLPSTVLVRGTAPSYMLGSGTSPAYDLQPNGTTFDVADVTGNANADLIIGAGSSTFLHSPAATSSGGSLTKTGAGTLELDGANTYTGPTTINAGTLALGASAALLSSSIAIASGATLDVAATSGGLTLSVSGEVLSGSGTVNGSVTDGSSSVILPGGNGTAGTLTINNNLTLGNGGSLNLDLSSSPGSGNDLIQVNGNLTLASGAPTPVNFNFLNGVPANGTYTLINCSGTITGTAATAFTNAANSRYNTTFSQSGKTIQVTFAGSNSNLVWTGTDPVTPSTWDLATSTNWFDGTGPNVFYALDPVLFDDTSADTNVTLNVTVAPAAVLVNTTNAYTIGGGGTIAGNTSLTKTNTGSLTLNAANTFTGPVIVQAGKVLLAGNSPLGANLNSITVSNGAAVDFNGGSMNSVNTRNYSFTLAGSGPDGNGALLNSGGAIYSYANVSNLTLSADATIGGSGRWDVGSGSAGQIINGNGHNLIKIGAGSMDFRPQFVTNLASITFSGGTLFDDSSYSFNTPATASTIITNLGSTLAIGSGLTWNTTLVVSNGIINNNSGSGSVYWLGSVNVQGTNLFNNSGAQFFAGSISGPGTIDVNGGAAPLLFSNANTYTGGIVISNAPITTTSVDATAGSAAVIAANPSALGTGPVTISSSYPAFATNASYLTTNVLRAVEFAFSAPGTVSNNIILPSTAITNVSLHGRDSGQVINLAGVISGGFAGLTNWIDFADANAIGVMRYGNPANTFLGNITAFRGALAITGDGSLGNAANLLRLNNTGGLRFDAPNISVAHNITATLATVFNVFGDNNGDGIPETPNAATINSVISGSVALTVSGGLTTAGNSAGSLTLGGNNTFSGALTVNTDTKLIASHTNALGTTAGATTVNAGGSLSLNLNGTYASEPVTLNGYGVAAGGVGVGAVENLAGNNILPGNITLNSFSGVGVTAGSLTLSGVISGAFPLTKLGSGPLTLSATETYSAGTIVSAGTLFLNGSLPAGNAVSVNAGGTLGGNGTINAPVTVQTGATLAPGVSAIGKLVVNGPLNLFGTTAIELNKASLTNDVVTGISTVLYGGTLAVTNLGGTLAVGDTFKLFSAQSYQGSFATLALPALGANLAWSNSLAVNGSLQVVTNPPAVNLAPTNLVATLAGNSLTLQWPADHTGWRLLVQTNNLSLGISSNTNDWTTVSGSAATNQEIIAVDPTKPTEFYRLVYP